MYYAMYMYAFDKHTGRVVNWQGLEGNHSIIALKTIGKITAHCDSSVEVYCIDRGIETRNLYKDAIRNPSLENLAMFKLHCMETGLRVW